MIQASVRLFCVITCVSSGMPAQRSVVRDDGMRTQQAHAAHAAKRPQSSVPGGQEVRVSDSLAMGSTNESNNQTKLTNSEAAGNQGKANIDTGNGMQLKTFTPGIDDVDGMPASKGEGGYSYVQMKGDSNALGGGHQGVEADEGRNEEVETPDAVATGGEQTVTGEKKEFVEPTEDIQAQPGEADRSLFSKAEKGIANIMENLNVLAKGAANQQVHLKSHRKVIVELKDKFYELKYAILVKMGILKDRLKKMENGMNTAQKYEETLPDELDALKLAKPANHPPLEMEKDDGALQKAVKEEEQGELTKIERENLGKFGDKFGSALFAGDLVGPSTTPVGTGGGSLGEEQEHEDDVHQPFPPATAGDEEGDEEDDGDTTHQQEEGN